MAEFDPAELAAAPVVMILHNDGRADLTVANNVDDAALAAYVREVADFIEAGKHREGCEACASNTPHEHDDSSAPPE